MTVPQTGIFQGMFDTVISFTSNKFHVNLWSLMFFKKTNSVSRGIKDMCIDPVRMLILP